MSNSIIKRHYFTLSCRVTPFKKVNEHTKRMRTIQRKKCNPFPSKENSEQNSRKKNKRPSKKFLWTYERDFLLFSEILICERRIFLIIFPRYRKLSFHPIPREHECVMDKWITLMMHVNTKVLLLSTSKTEKKHFFFKFIYVFRNNSSATLWIEILIFNDKIFTMMEWRPKDIKCWKASF